MVKSPVSRTVKQMGVRWATVAAAKSGSKYLLSAVRIRPVKRMHASGVDSPVKIPEVEQGQIKGSVFA
jgi:hypothetical protein